MIHYFGHDGIGSRLSTCEPFDPDAPPLGFVCAPEELEELAARLEAAHGDAFALCETCRARARTAARMRRETEATLRALGFGARSRR